jgi:hypothetical protein
VLFMGGPVLVPLLYGHKLDGTEFYVDQDRNVYKTTFPQDNNYRIHPRTAFQNFPDDNALPAGTLYFQGQGFNTWPPGDRETPAARDTTKKVLHVGARVVTTAGWIAAIVLTDGWAATAFAYASYLGMGVSGL